MWSVFEVAVRCLGYLWCVLGVCEMSRLFVMYLMCLWGVWGGCNVSEVPLWFWDDAVIRWDKATWFLWHPVLLFIISLWQHCHNTVITVSQCLALSPKASHTDATLILWLWCLWEWLVTDYKGTPWSHIQYYILTIVVQMLWPFIWHLLYNHSDYTKSCTLL